MCIVLPANGSNTTSSQHPHPNSAALKQTQTQTQQPAQKKKSDAVDPVAMYETVRNRIAALEEEEVHGEEEERRIGALFTWSLFQLG